MKVEKEGNIILFDKQTPLPKDEEVKDKDGKPLPRFSILDLPSVGENAPEPPPADDTINGAKKLMKEAVAVNTSLLSLSGLEESYKLKEKDPSRETESQVKMRVGYVWKQFPFGEDKHLYVRTTVHTYEEGKEGGQDFMNVYSLNEYQLEKSKWRKMLDSDRATVFATELMENACKVA